MISSLIPPSIGGMPVVQATGLSKAYEVDYVKGEVRLDIEQAGWNWTLLLFDRRFMIINKKGGPNLPIAEVDHKRSQIYVNWGHPIKLQMDERGFLRTAACVGPLERSFGRRYQQHDGFAAETYVIFDPP